MLNFRPAQMSDKDRMFEISSKIWGGTDFVLKVFDKWMADQTSDITIAELDDVTVGFARYIRQNRSEIWLEGIRTDSVHRGKGYATSLTAHYLEKARQEQAEVVRFSAFIKSVESMHLTEKIGFKKDACFSYSRKDVPKVRPVKSESQVVKLMSTATAWHFAANSDYIRMANGYISYGWQFKKLTYELMDKLVKDGWVYGVIKNGKITAMMIITENSHGDDGTAIGFLEGDAAGISQLLEYATMVAFDRNCEYISTMAIINEKVLEVLKMNDFYFWVEDPGKVNVFVYSYTL